MGRILTEEAIAPSAWNPRIPPELDVIIGKALAKKKEDRYEDVSLLKEQLKTALKYIQGR